MPPPTTFINLSKSSEAITMSSNNIKSTSANSNALFDWELPSTSAFYGSARIITPYVSVWPKFLARGQSQAYNYDKSHMAAKLNELLTGFRASRSELSNDEQRYKAEKHGWQHFFPSVGRFPSSHDLFPGIKPIEIGAQMASDYDSVEQQLLTLAAKEKKNLLWTKKVLAQNHAKAHNPKYRLLTGGEKEWYAEKWTWEKFFNSRTHPFPGKRPQPYAEQLPIEYQEARATEAAKRR